MLNEDFWDDLLDKIEEGKVIPVIGPAAITAGPSNDAYYPWLARRLAVKHGYTPEQVPSVESLSDIVGGLIAASVTRNKLCTSLARIIRKESPPPGATLLALAKVLHFKLFLTTTIDSQLENALNQARYAGAPRTQALAFFPGAPTDLPQRLADLPSATVYHLHGRVSTAPGEYVAWDDDLLDFICELQRHMGTDPLRRLSMELKSHSLLVLGLNLGDWPVRFLLRVASQDSLSRHAQSSLVAEGPPSKQTQSMVLFFSSVSKNISVIECDPRAFTDDLALRWQKRHASALADLAAKISTPPAPKMEPGAIFISYAREDEQAVRRLKTGIESHGCEVWYDRERLGAATDFHIELRSEIVESCCAFISIISRTTENPVGHNYFMVERNWAREAAQGRSDAQRAEFYIPVLIDEILPERLIHEPAVFERNQWNHVPGGDISRAPLLGERLAAVQKRFREASAAQQHASAQALNLNPVSSGAT